MNLTHINAASGALGTLGAIMLFAGSNMTGFLGPGQKVFATITGFLLLSGAFIFTALRHRKSDERDEFEAVLLAAVSLLIFALAPLMPSNTGSAILVIAGFSVLLASVLYYHLIHVYPRVRERFDRYFNR